MKDFWVRARFAGSPRNPFWPSVLCRAALVYLFSFIYHSVLSLFFARFFFLKILRCRRAWHVWWFQRIIKCGIEGEEKRKTNSGVESAAGNHRRAGYPPPSDSSMTSQKCNDVKNGLQSRNCTGVCMYIVHFPNLFKKNIFPFTYLLL